MPIKMLVLSLLLFSTPILSAQPRPKSEPSALHVEGEVLVVVTKLPFDVVGPEGADLYFWRMPPGWTGTEAANRLTVSAAPQGTAVVALQTLKVDWDAKKTVSKAYALKVNVGQATPPVPPDPKPPDPPLPPIPVAKAWVVVIEETQEAQATRRTYYADPALNAYVKSKGWKMRVADKDVKDPSGQPPKDLAPYLKMSQGKALPWLYVVSSDGIVRANQALPPTAAELTALLRKIGG